MPVCEPGVTNTKTSQDHLSVSGPMGGGTPSVDGGLNQGQLISGSPASIPAGLPRLAECSGDRRIEVLKRQGQGIRWRKKTGPFGHAIRPFITRQSHVGRDPTEGNVFATGVKSGQEALYFQDQSMPGV